MKSTVEKDAMKSNTYRWITIAFGILLITIAITILVVSELTLLPVIASVAIGILGIDAIVSAYRKTISLPARIGPLP